MQRDVRLSKDERYAVEHAIARAYSAGPNPRGVYDVSMVPTLVTETIEGILRNRLTDARQTLSEVNSLADVYATGEHAENVLERIREALSRGRAG